MKWGKTEDQKWQEILSEAKEAAIWKPIFLLFPARLEDGRFAWLETVETQEIYCIVNNGYISNFNSTYYRAIKNEMEI